MTPLKFEALYQAEWQELEALLDVVLGRKAKGKNTTEAPRGERIAALYRRACEQLALARARSYPAYLLDRLERLTADAHQVIYQQREFGVARVVATRVARFSARRARRCRLRVDRDGAVVRADVRRRRARVLRARSWFCRW